MQAQSVLDFFLVNVRDFGFQTAALVKKDGQYKEITWSDLGQQVEKIAAGLMALGVAPKDRVSIVSQTRIEWICIDLAILASGAVTVPIYHSSLADDCQYIVKDAESVVVFAENQEQVKKFLENKSELSHIKKIVQIVGDVENNPWVISLEALIAMGKVDKAALESCQKSLTPQSLLTIMYTSGTTGRPKGVVLTHDALVYEAEAIASVNIIRNDDVQLFFLPLAHVLAKIIEISWLRSRHVLAFAESIQTLKENLQEVRPTLMAGVPRIFEKFYAAVVQKALSQGGLKSVLFAKALQLSEERGEAKFLGETFKHPIAFALLKRLVFKKVNKLLGAALGGRMRLMVSGGAPLARKVGYFFTDAGFQVLEGYGLTETSAATCVNRPGEVKIGTVGLPLPQTEVRIAKDGEILVKGRGVMQEYWKKPAETAEILKDGWLHTGDIGVIDRDGCLRITDRKKDIIVNAAGKNIAPQKIENILKTNPLISHALVYGDKRNFLSALVTLDAEVLRKFADDRKIAKGISYAELTQHVEIKKAVEEIIAASSKELASYETIKKFKILEHDFTVETGELTPTLKVKRKALSERYKEIFDGFYGEKY